MAKKFEKKVEMENKKKELKDIAVKFLSKGKLDKALEIYLQLWKLAPEDFRVKMKIGETLQKLKRPREAASVYKKVAAAYANDGFLIQAISVCKIILELAPADLESKNLLSSLYAKRGMEKESRLAGGKTPQPAQQPPKPPPLPEIPPEGVSEAIPMAVLEPEEKEVDADELLDALFAEDVEPPRRQLPIIPLFSDLQTEEFHAVIDSLTPWKVPRKTIICQEGSPAESMFIIAHGQVKVQIKDQKNQTVDLATLNPGDFFGEIGLFTQSPRTASCVAVGDTELLEIKKVDFDRIVKWFPRVKTVLHEFYTSRILDTILAKSELFGALIPEVRKDLAKRFIAREYQDRDQIIQEGDEGDALYMIRNGEVEVLLQKDSHLIPLATLKSGDFFGEVSLLTGQKRTASVQAKGKCDCIFISRDDFQWAVDQCPEVMRVAKAYVEKRVQDTIKTVAKS